MADEVPDENHGIRRHYARGSARGESELRIHPEGRVILAEVITSSQNGFRIRYRDNSLLNIGAKVRVTYGWGKIQARVVWCHTTGDWTEAGFVLLHDDVDSDVA